MFNAEDMIKFANMKVADLKAELKKRGIKGYSKMKKAELQEKVLSIWEAEAEVNTVPVNTVPVAEEPVKEEEVTVNYEEVTAEIKEDPVNIVPLNTVPLTEEDLDAFQNKYDLVIGDVDNAYFYHASIIEDMKENEKNVEAAIEIYSRRDSVKKCLKQLARLYHPDLGGDPEKMIKFGDYNKKFRSYLNHDIEIAESINVDLDSLENKLNDLANEYDEYLYYNFYDDKNVDTFKNNIKKLKEYENKLNDFGKEVHYIYDNSYIPNHYNIGDFSNSDEVNGYLADLTEYATKENRQDILDAIEDFRYCIKIKKSM